MDKEVRLRACQLRAKEAIVEDCVAHLTHQPHAKERRYGFVAPTGSGKTITTAKAIKEIAQRLNGNVFFIYLTLGKGDLDGQVRGKMTEYLNRSGIKVKDASEACRDAVVNNILIVEGWDALNKTNKDGTPINHVMQEKEACINFPQLCDLAHQQDTPIVLIIDEVHAYAFTEKSLEIRHLHIKPNYTLEVSATPKTAGWLGYQRITFEEASNSGLIKSAIQRDTFLSSRDGIISGANKLQEMIALAHDCNAVYNPRMLVFMPNASSDGKGDELNTILELLETQYGWTEASGEVVIWMSKRKSDNYERCKDNLGQVKVILTKEAIDTGIDIPAIQVIVQLRPTASVQVEVQKLGRGLRMPEQRHYKNHLDRLYFYVFNDCILDYVGAEYLKDVLDKKQSTIKREFADEVAIFGTLPISYYERISPLREFESDDFAEVFVPLFSDRINKYVGYNFDTTYSEECRIDGSVDLDSKSVSGEKFVPQTLSLDDVDELYHQRLRTSLKHMFKHLGLIEDVIGCYVDSQITNNSTVLQQIFILNNLSRIEEMVKLALSEGEEQVGVSKKKITADYSLPTEYMIEGDIDMQYKKFLHDKYFNNRTGRSVTESKFEQYLEQSSKVKWWMKNYDKQYGQSFSTCYEVVNSKQGVFFPDYIVGLVDGRYLIVDTKGGTIDSNENAKRESLIAAIDNVRVIGGIVKLDNNHFYRYGSQNTIEALSNYL